MKKVLLPIRLPSSRMSPEGIDRLAMFVSGRSAIGLYFPRDGHARRYKHMEREGNGNGNCANAQLMYLK